ncbi:unnamed protein product, partial [Mesorhabditis belari]|uniref:non-specific serine/threonine protein kinase n=1 Tax=Mesorhabditis belari TaxID=2138241 RepID=A0AAF3J7I4_9BILA
MTLSADECKEIQENEKLVLESIYGADLQIMAGPWKIWKPLEAIIALQPTEGASRRPDQKKEKALVGQDTTMFSVSLHVKCTLSYPNEVPQIFLEKERGIPKCDLDQLLGLLNEKTKELQGMSMIMDLCEIVRSFLYTVSQKRESLHAGMAEQHAEKQRQLERQRASSQQKEWDQVDEEREKRQLEAEWKREEQQERQRMSSQTDQDVCYIGSHAISIIENRPAEHERRVNQLCQEWSGTYKGQTVLVSEWIFQHTLGRKEAKKKMPSFQTFLEKLAEFENVFNGLAGLMDVDASVVPYAFLHIDRLAIKETHFHVRIYVGQYIALVDLNLQTILDRVTNDVGAVRRLATSLVCGLRWLHEQQLAHGSLAMNSLWTDDCTAFRLGDWQIGRALNDLADLFRSTVADKPIASVEKLDQKALRKKDLFVLGTLLDTLRVGPCESSSISPLLQAFSADCQSAKSIDELVDHPYLSADALLLVNEGSSSSAGLQTVAGASTRLGRDFFIVKSLGKGAFGEVLLARNKLDLVHYAVKVIPLDPRSEKLNRKMTREAKLFAKLNHPNVVRYYNAWIDNTANFCATASPVSRKQSEKLKLPLPKVDDSLLPTHLRHLDLPKKEVKPEASEWSAEWTTSFRGKRESSESSSDTSETGGDLQLFATNASDGTDFDVIFEESGAEKAPTTNGSCSAPTRLIYIQMEYCSKGTLRGLIDSGALKGNSRLGWKLFGEILSGLDYIHSQGMIHRDIKPMNILLDADHHVKIGDFGLATRELLIKKDAGQGVQSALPIDQSMTTQIGTELYMAPELLASNPDGQPYTAKVDIYSTGIVLFEIFYRPLPQGMERISLIQALRKSASVPNDFLGNLSGVQGNACKSLIEEMINPNPMNRPTIRSLISEGRVPVAEIDDLSFQKTFAQTVRRRGGALFSWMMSALVETPTPLPLNYHFDRHICADKQADEVIGRERTLRKMFAKIETLLRVRAFESTPNHLFVPTSDVITPKGSRKPFIVTDTTAIPIAPSPDLRCNFVRFCARNAIKSLKRYHFGKTYSTKDGGLHPLEQWELNVDILEKASSAEAIETQIISLVSEISTVVLQGAAKPVLRLGHMGLITAIFRHLNVMPELQVKLLELMHQTSIMKKQRSLSEQIEMWTEVAGKVAASLGSFLVTVTSITALREELKALRRSKDTLVSEGVNVAITHMERVLDSLWGLPFEIELCTYLVYRPKTFADGLVFQFCAPGPKPTQRVPFCAGGRYDSVLERARAGQDELPPGKLALCGCSIHMELLLQLYLAKNEIEPPCQVLVSSYSRALSNEKLKLAKELWSHCVSADIRHEPLDSEAALDAIKEHCRKSGIATHLIMFDANSILVRHDKAEYGKVDVRKAVEIVLSLSANTGNTGNLENRSSLSGGAVTRSSLTSSSYLHASNVSALPMSPFTLVTYQWATTEKPRFGDRKKIEGQCQGLLSDTIRKFSPTTRVNVLITELPTDILGAVHGKLEISLTEDQLRTFFDSFTRQFGKFKEDLEVLYTLILPLISSRSSSSSTSFQMTVLVLYSIPANIYRITM